MIERLEHNRLNLNNIIVESVWMNERFGALTEGIPDHWKHHIILNDRSMHDSTSIELRLNKNISKNKVISFQHLNSGGGRIRNSFGMHFDADKFITKLTKLNGYLEKEEYQFTEPIQGFMKNDACWFHSWCLDGQGIVIVNKNDYANLEEDDFYFQAKTLYEVVSFLNGVNDYEEWLDRGGRDVKEKQPINANINF